MRCPETRVRGAGEGIAHELVREDAAVCFTCREPCPRPHIPTEAYVAVECSGRCARLRIVRARLGSDESDQKFRKAVLQLRAEIRDGDGVIDDEQRAFVAIEAE